MQVWPIGVSPSHLSYYWPTWAAAVLRRHGQPPASSADAAAYRLALHLWLTGHGLLHADDRDALIWRRPPLVLEDRPVSDEAPAKLDLRWPSDEPPETARIIVVERVIHEPYPVPGSFIDVLY